MKPIDSDYGLRHDIFGVRYGYLTSPGNYGVRSAVCMIETERVREYVCCTLIAPARKEGKSGITVVAGPVAEALNLRNRMPLVCKAIGARKFHKECGVTQMSRTGRRSGATATWVFSIEPPAFSARPRSLPSF